MHLVLTGADLAHLGDLRSGVMQKQPDGTRAPTRDIPILCRDRVNHVGDAVAFIVADSRALAQDAAELIEVDYDAEDAAAVTATALAEGTPLVWPELGSNRAFLYRARRQGQDRRRLRQGRPGGRHQIHQQPAGLQLHGGALGDRRMEGRRGPLRADHRLAGRACACATSIASKVFKIAPEKLRVITPDVGGGFGPKAFVYREYPLVLEAAKRLGRPVKWASDRTEHFLADAQGRDNCRRGRDGARRGRPLPRR